MQEFFRKPYIAKSYREMMSGKANASVWTKIVESHSEFEKPYLSGTNYDRMQYFHPIMPGLSPWDFDFDFNFDKWDFPFDPYDPSTWPWDVSFFCHSQPCYCADQTRCVEVGCAYPLIGATLRPGCEDLTAEVSGTQVCITAGSNPSGTCRIDLIQQVPENKLGLPAGLVGSHGAILVDECDDCVDCEAVTPVSWDYDSNPETIAREDSVAVVVSDGVGPYSWAVSGTGFTLAEETTSSSDNTLISDDTACGTATIAITDDCGNHASGEVRCTEGVWDLLSSAIGACVLPGEIATIAQVGSTDAFTAEAIKGKYKQHNQYDPSGAYGACATSISSGCLTIGCGTCGNHCFNASWPTMCGVAHIACLYVDPDYEPETAQKFVLVDATATYEWICI